MASLGLSFVWGPMPAGEGIARLRGLLEEVTDDPVLEAHVIGDQAGLEAMLGRFDAAREHYAYSVRVLRDRGLKRALGAQTIVGADIELLAGDAEAAERELRVGYEIAEETGNQGSLATLAPLLADVLYIQERFGEADAFAAAGERAAAPDDLASQILWRTARAKLLARTGQAEKAEELASGAVRLAHETDGLNIRAAALLSLAEVQRLSGRNRSAAEQLEEAVRLYERKENVVAAQRARTLLSAAVA